jgi:poly-gamma-glutamate synthesis protein (capsule biosynthesis protein)
MRNALKALGAVLAVIALCTPLMLLPGEQARPASAGNAGVTLTVPPTVVVATTIPGLETTTTTTEVEPAAPPPEPTSSTTTTTGPIDITIAAAGDVLTPPAVLGALHDADTNSYDFAPVFAPIAPYLAKADYTVAGLGPRMAGAQAGYGSDAVANAPRELAFALRATGIDLVATANSHSLDFGWEGVVGTIDRLEAAGLEHVGTSRSKDERTTPVIVDIRGIKVAFLNYTASVAKTLPPDAQKDFAVNLLDPATVKTDVLSARTWGADIVIAMLAYGTEYEQQPSKEQTTLSEDLLLNHGVDAILGYRARMVQPIGHIFQFASWRANDKYVAYSLGDFLAAPQADRESSGMVAYLHLQKRGLRTYITGVSYLPVYIQVSTPAAGTSTTGSSTTSTTGGTTPPGPATYRVLPVLPGLDPDTDVPLSTGDKQRMAQLWEEVRALLYRPDERITPLYPADLGL